MTVATQWTSIFTQKSSVITTQEFVNRICQESESYLLKSYQYSQFQ